MISVRKHIESHVKELNPGTIIFPADFRGAGSENAIKLVLSRLAKESVLDRLAHGIYYLPQYDQELGKLTPSMEKIAEAIAAKEHVRIIPTGSTALNQLGLSTQVPMNVVYLTDGPRRMIKIGKRSLVFKSTTPKKFAYKGRLTGPLIIALEDQAIDTFSADTKDKIADLLAKEKAEFFAYDLKLAPAKVHDFLLSLKNKRRK